MIDVKISEKYHIVPYGLHGVEVQKNGRQIKIFCSPFPYEINWLMAVKWCDKYYEAA